MRMIEMAKEKKFIAIGFWYSKTNRTLPKPQRLIGPSCSKRKHLIAEYLNSGCTFIQYRGYSHCRFNCGRPRNEMGSRDLTDGIWVWPEGLSHYVWDHEVMLPEAFIEHAENNFWTIPKVEISGNLSSLLQSVNRDFWEKYYSTKKRGNTDVVKDVCRRFFSNRERKD